MQVSFIIPLFNCLAVTQAGLASLRASLPAGLRHEILLVDDGSTDGTRAWLATFGADPVVRVVLNERNLGYAAANNRGAALARGDCLALLNNDLVLSSGWLEPMLATVRHLGAHCGFVGNLQDNTATGELDHAGIIVNLKGKPEHARTLPLAARLPGPWRRRRVPAVTGACLLVPRNTFLDLGGFSEEFRNGCEDVDLCFRATAAGLVNVVVLDSRIGHHVSTSPGRKVRDEQNTRLLVRRWSAALARHAARRWCAHYLREAWHTCTANTQWAAAAQALAYRLHLRSEPPVIALQAMHAALDREEARWRALLDRPTAPPDQVTRSA